MSFQRLLDRIHNRMADDIDITHSYCDCNPDLALCGVDVSDAEEYDGPDLCVVCDDLEALPCERCGQ